MRTDVRINKKAFLCDLASSKNTFWDVSGNEPIMLKYLGENIKFNDWWPKYGYDEESKWEKPSHEILKRVEYAE